MPESHARPVLSHTERIVGSTTVVTLSGEVDLAMRLSLAPRLDVLTAGPRPDLVLDLRPVAFIDCAGLGLLCRARNRVAARGGRLRLVSDSASFQRILRRTGLDGVFVLLPEFGTAPATAPVSRQGPVVPAGQG